MKWFKEHKRAWRVGFLLLLALAISGAGWDSSCHLAPEQAYHQRKERAF